MPSRVSADRSTPQPPERDAVEALITQARRLRGGLAAVRPDAETEDDRRLRWQQALCDLAAHQLDDLDGHLGQLREGLPLEEPAQEPQPAPPTPAPVSHGSLVSRVGSGEWNLLTDEVQWSAEMYQVLGRDPAEGPLTLDELPSLVHVEDQPPLATMVTDCLVDGRPIDGEFRLVRPGGEVRTVHMTGEPVLADDGSTACMWAVLRDVSALRRSQSALRESRESLRREEDRARDRHRLTVELQESVLPPWRGSLRLPAAGPTALEVAARYLPAENRALIGGDWYDALPLPDGQALLTVGDLTGHGLTATSTMATLLGALRGMAVAGQRPGPLLGCLNHLLETGSQPALGSALCCLYSPATRELTWSQAGHPAPVLFRGGAGRVLTPPAGVLLGATGGSAYDEATEHLLPGDLLVLHTDGLVPRRAQAPGAGLDDADHLLTLAPRFASCRDAQDALRLVVEEFGAAGREDDACVMVARVA
ncbi:PP2C family protein-serine/threonine phosphatase [Streptomyces sp. NPDC059740]|uniref:PP2C family protein-serine/threonine phosphatase n=1 Tax=Streptomyces sp. NPDC059740 TaxID=3346926 RepID=UPI0036510B64